MNEFNLKEVSERLKSLREMSDVTVEEMAEYLGKTAEDYSTYETGTVDMSFNFLYNCAKKLKVDITDIITGESARLNAFEVTRAGEGMKITRRQGFMYRHLAGNLRGRLSEPFVVTAPYDANEVTKPIKLSTHEGQELDYILDGALKVNIDGHETVLNVGDSVYYDSSKPHGMIAIGGKPCKFIAVVMNK